MGISTFHEEVRRVTDQAKRGLILVQENPTLAADHRNVDAYLGPMKDGMQVLAMTSAIIGYLAHLQYAKVQNHIIWQSETFRRVVWDALGDEWERMNIEREQGPIHMTCPWLIRFTDNIPRDCPSHLEWYQRLIDHIKTIRHEEYSTVGRTGNAWMDMDPVWREYRREEIISMEPTPKMNRSEAEVARRQPGEEAVTRTNRSDTSVRREPQQEIDLTVGSPGVVTDIRQPLYEGAIFSPKRFTEAEAKEPSDLEEESVEARQNESDIRLQNQQLRTQLEDMHKQMLAVIQRQSESATSTAYKPAKPNEARGQSDVAGGLLAELRTRGGSQG
jgi:hypothetical protein